LTRRIFHILFSLILINSISAQQTIFDSLKYEISIASDDTIRLLLLERIASEYSEINPDSAYHYATEIPDLAKKLNLKLEEVVGLGEIGYALLNLGNFPRSLQSLLSGINIAKDPASEKKILPAHFPPHDAFTDRTVSPTNQRLTKLSRILQYAGVLYGNTGNFEKAVVYLKEAILLAEKSNNLRILSTTYSNLGRIYLSLNKRDSALFCLRKGYDYAIRADYHRYIGSNLLNLGRVYLAMKQPDIAKTHFLRAMSESTKHRYFRGVVASHLALADIFKSSGKTDSILYHIQQGLIVAHTLNAPELFLRCYTALADYYKQIGQSDSIVKYQSLIIKLNENLFSSKQVQQFQNIDFDAQQRQQEILAAKKEYQNSMQKYLLLGILAVFLLIGLLLYRSNLHRQKSNTMLQKQNKEIEIAMANLKTTQAQLIQSEKMASLGELTAGIAHEIQNPLNFVNNFSEVNYELINELKNERIKEPSNRDENFQQDVIQNIAENSLKINQHGKRADAIVKAMLLHSQKSSGNNEPTNINALAEEYLRLAYHGYRVRDQNFSANLKLDLDPELPLVNVIPQNIGRVLLNLYNNAFWAVSERLKGQKVKGEGNYEPKVLVSTTKVDKYIEIRIRDNGPGIPQHVIDKIFQPFFTTKPTGQGTGLGLSLSYDIVKAHGGSISVISNYSEPGTIVVNTFNNPEGGPSGGELKVDTKKGAVRLNDSVGQGSEFIIHLPIKG